MRFTHHLVVLVLVAAMSLFAVVTSGGLLARAGGAPSDTSAPARQSAARESGVVVSAPPTNAELPHAQPSVASQPVGPAPGPTKPSAPRWVQNFRPTVLYGGPEAAAARVGEAEQFSFYRLADAADGPAGSPATATGTDRVKLYDPGRGSGRLPSYVWANSEDFGPSGPPTPEFELASGGVTNPVTQRQLPERTGAAWPRIPSAELAVVLDGESGGILYGKNAHGRVAPASLTKIMTAIVAIERGEAKHKVTVDVDSRTMWESTVMGLEPGETVSLETLLYGLMLPSGNDAALAIARHIGGTDPRFVELMNEKARALGLENSQFRNPHGLDDVGHYSSAYDLAMMSRYGMQDQLFYSLSATRNWRAEGFNLFNLNRLLGQYPGADGVKVGYTDDAGRCIVSSATRDGRRVFVALIRSGDPVGESGMLLDYAFDNFHWPT